jgi:uncharacterized protein
MLRKPILTMFAACLLGSGWAWAAEEQPAAAAPAATEASAAPAAPMVPTLSVDKVDLANGGTITVSGKAEPGKPVFLEVVSEHKVGGSFFDGKPNKEGKIPYKLYITKELPAFYKIVLPTSQQPVLDKFKKEGKGWSYSAALKETGGAIAYSAPGKANIDSFQASLVASIVGSRGELLPALDDKERVSRSMQIMKARYRSVDKLLSAKVEQKEDGSFSAVVKIPEGSPDLKYFITAVVDKNVRSEPATFENKVGFPVIYMENAGTSLNIFIPFLLVFAIATFGVLMGAGGGFIINPVMVMLFPIPHNIVAGTVTPTVLFSQGSGILNYSKIKFINWKVGVTLGIAMLAGGFIGPALTTMITLDQFKSAFGWILFVLAALMFWQTTPGYMAKNKKEQAIMKEFQKRAAEAAKAKA